MDGRPSARIPAAGRFIFGAPRFLRHRSSPGFSILRKTFQVRVIQDGHLQETESPVIPPDCPGIWYGDGLFETLLIREGVIRLWDFHTERLFQGMRLLGYAVEPGMAAMLGAQVLALCEAEQCLDAARVRLNVFRGAGKLFDAAESPTHYRIQATAVTRASLEFQEGGIRIGIYPGVVRSFSDLSPLKTQNYLPSVMTARYAAARGWEDALLLSDAGSVSESAIANVFIVKEDMILTPPLSEGCVAGVMRRRLLELLPSAGFRVMEARLTPGDLREAQEIFLTNAVRRIRAVSAFEEKRYPVKVARGIFRLVAG